MVISNDSLPMPGIIEIILGWSVEVNKANQKNQSMLIFFCQVPIIKFYEFLDIPGYFLKWSIFDITDVNRIC